MIEMQLTYDDLDGNPTEGTFCFHLSPAEIAEKEFSVEGGYSNYIEELSKLTKATEIIPAFRKFIAETVGKRAADNKRFIKNDDVRSEFMESDAFSVFFMRIMNDPEGGANFIKGVMPKAVQDRLGAGDGLKDAVRAAAGEEVSNPQSPDTVELPAGDDTPIWETEMRLPRQEELKGLSQDQMARAFRWRQLITTAPSDTPEA